MRMPQPRPLYRVPAVLASGTVVLVEGEKCADALAQQGIVATTAMGGAATRWDPVNTTTTTMGDRVTTGTLMGTLSVDAVVAAARALLARAGRQAAE